jgi:hypothetical protein
MLHAIWYVAMTIFAFLMTFSAVDRPDASSSSALCVSLSTRAESLAAERGTHDGRAADHEG